VSLITLARNLALTVLLFAQPAAAAPRARSTPEPERSIRTTLRWSDLSVLLGRSRGQQELRHVSVRVRNIGRNEARHVQVVAHVPGGPRVLLRGPKTLRAGGTAVYLSSAKTLAVGAGKITIEAGCFECR